MKYMLDTNICSYIIKNKPKEVLEKFKMVAMDDCCISAVTVAELKYWVARNKRLHDKSRNDGSPKINERIIDHFISHLLVQDFDAFAAATYGRLRDASEANGTPVGAADLMIGAHAVSLNLILVTNNPKDFAHFPGLRLENWVSLTTVRS